MDEHQQMEISHVSLIPLIAISLTGILVVIIIFLDGNSDSKRQLVLAAGNYARHTAYINTIIDSALDRYVNHTDPKVRSLVGCPHKATYEGD